MARKKDEDDGGKVLVFKPATDGPPVAVPAEVVRAAERAYRVYEAQARGDDWMVIADREGYPSVGAAQSDMKRYLAEGASMVMASTATEMLQLEVARLNRLQSAIWDKALEGNIPAIMTVRTLIMDRVKVLGLDANAVQDEAAKTRTIVVYGDQSDYTASLQRAVGNDGNS